MAFKNFITKRGKENFISCAGCGGGEEGIVAERKKKKMPFP